MCLALAHINWCILGIGYDLAGRRSRCAENSSCPQATAWGVRDFEMLIESRKAEVEVGVLALFSS